MTYGEIIQRVYETFREEVVEIADYRPYIIPNSVVVWLKNGDRFIYIVNEEETKEEINQKVGYWILVAEPDESEGGSGDATYECSECGCSEVHSPKIRVNYCWNCGKRMKGEKKSQITGAQSKKEN